MTYNDDILCGPQVIADVFNNFFISAYNPPINTALTCDRMFNNVNFDLEDVSSALSAASLGTEIDHFPEHLLRYAGKPLTFHLLKLFEAITSVGIFPQRWKYAVINLVYKIGMKRSITNVISLHNPDIVCLCETWFDDIFVDNVSLHPDYVTATRADCKAEEHGSVLILCKHTVNWKHLKCLVILPVRETSLKPVITYNHMCL